MISVISFNIRCCNDPNGNSISERAPRLKKVVESYDADLIGLQEFSPLWKEHIDKIFGDKYDMVNIYRAKDEHESTPVLWKKDRFSLLKINKFWFSDTPDIESRGWDELYHCHRMCVHVKLFDKQTNREINFLNTHFGFGDNGQVKSARLIIDYCKSFQHEPVCIVGDFNMEPKSNGYSEMVRGFTDVNAVTAKDDRHTYHDYSLDPAKGKLIDYCFVNNQFTAVERKLLNETVDDKFPSDHYGIFMMLK